MPTDSDNKLWSRLDRLHTDLREARGKLLEMLSANTDEEIRDLRFPIFAFLCDTIYDAAKKWHGYETDFPFYFWPGYDSIREPGVTHKRTSLQVRIFESEEHERDGWDVECGISPSYDLPADLAPEIAEFLDWRKRRIRDWLPKHADLRDKAKFGEIGVSAARGLLPPEKGEVQAATKLRVLANPASIWFSILLRRADPHQQEFSDFVPGGTHGWLSQIDDIRGLLVERPGENANGDAQNPLTSPTFISLKLPSFETLGPALAAHIPEGLERLDQHLKNKTPREHSSWPWCESGADPADDPLRRELYTPWLLSVFRPNHGDEIAATTEHLSDQQSEKLAYLKKRLVRLQESAAFFEKRFARIRQQIANHSDYSFWDSLKLDTAFAPSFSSSTNVENISLGSAMLLSGKPLDQDFLTALRLWIEQIFLLLRQFEAGRSSTEAGESLGASDLMETWSHELNHEVRALREDRLLTPVSVSSHFLPTAEPARTNVTEFLRGMGEHGLVAIPKVLVRQHLDYISSWLGRSTGLSKDVENSTDFAVVVNALCKRAISVASARPYIHRVVTSPAGCAEVNGLIEQRQFEINKVFSTDTLAEIMLIPPSYPYPPLALLAFSRLLFACILNAVKHAFAVNTTNRIIRLSIMSSAVGIRVSLLNSFTRDEKGCAFASKHSGTADAILALGMKFGLTRRELKFCVDDGNPAVWRTEFPLSRNYHPTPQVKQPWICIG